MGDTPTCDMAAYRVQGPFCRTSFSKPGAKHPFIKHDVRGVGIVPVTPNSYMLINNHFLTNMHANAILTELHGRSHLFDSPLITVHGRTVPIPRGQAAFGEGIYSYSNMNIPAQETPEYTQQLLTEIQRLLHHGDHDNKRFRYILVNRYMDGTQKIGRHSDDETDLVDDMPIVSYSVGTARRFIVRSKTCMHMTAQKTKHNPTMRNTVPSGPSPIHDIFDPKSCPGLPSNRPDLQHVPYTKWSFEVSAGHNTMIAMCGRFQRELVHEVPAEKSVTQVRYNLTIRANKL